MTPGELDTFIAGATMAEIAGYSGGRLVARRAVITSGDHRRVTLELRPDQRAFDFEDDDRVCVITDHYPSHDAIQGALLHGGARWVGDTARIEVDIDRSVSFDFRKSGSKERDS
jgi:hypothetical protein